MSTVSIILSCKCVAWKPWTMDIGESWICWLVGATKVGSDARILLAFLVCTHAANSQEAAFSRTVVPSIVCGTVQRDVRHHLCINTRDCIALFKQQSSSEPGGCEQMYMRSLSLLQCSWHVGQDKACYCSWVYISAENVLFDNFNHFGNIECVGSTTIPDSAHRCPVNNSMISGDNECLGYSQGFGTHSCWDSSFGWVTGASDLAAITPSWRVHLYSAQHLILPPSVYCYQFVRLLHIHRLSVVVQVPIALNGYHTS